MREKEFIEARTMMLPVLIKMFHKYVKLAGVQKARTEYAKDLMHDTIAQAFRNSKNPMYDHLSCIDLIKIKAKNVWADDYRKIQRSIPESNLDPIEFTWAEGDDPEVEKDVPLTLERLMTLSNARQADILNKRLDGFEVNEIAAMYNCSPAAVTMQIQRLKNKFLKGKP
jgi:DNA-directed RNA polymerase specialized sigma24 family protein